jgi:hypothetical protein
MLELYFFFRKKLIVRQFRDGFGREIEKQDLVLKTNLIITC